MASAPAFHSRMTPSRSAKTIASGAPSTISLHNHSCGYVDMRPSHLDLRAQLDHVVGGDAEDPRRRAGVGAEEHEERPPPAGEVGASGRTEGVGPQEVPGAAVEGGETLGAWQLQDG